MTPKSAPLTESEMPPTQGEKAETDASARE